MPHRVGERDLLCGLWSSTWSALTIGQAVAVVAMTAMHSQMCSMHQLHTQLGRVRLSAPRQAVARQAPAQRQKHFTVYARRPEAGIGMFGTKAGMTQIFTPEGLAISATVIALEEGNIVTQVHTTDTRGYNAVQVGYQVVPERKLTKPEAGHLKKAGVKPMRHLREFKVCKPTWFLSHIFCNYGTL